MFSNDPTQARPIRYPGQQQHHPRKQHRGPLDGHASGRVPPRIRGPSICVRSWWRNSGRCRPHSRQFELDLAGQRWIINMGGTPISTIDTYLVVVGVPRTEIYSRHPPQPSHRRRYQRRNEHRGRRDLRPRRPSSPRSRAPDATAHPAQFRHIGIVRRIGQTVVDMRGTPWGFCSLCLPLSKTGPRADPPRVLRSFEVM
ncbi:uncharacterized protein EV422DRAFT_208701 [Fimicolochytrium jonesii]|uniref:uncharacterized protein n=1 Tax=Fimicolochytrium jonesii TaxID=1396493 RepID=UPI0022FE570D|nr:uncharacterized protein EV422DRAFT_208701 [Fimicolochytrium jonesii]KAI8817861.1 hypothetical protein EV422DRAFT_208701 [Fimicolochytrium jonesii]